MESEKGTEKYLKREVTKLNGVSYKWVSPQMRGTPDQICIFNNGTVVFVEVKSEGETPELHQLRFHENLRRYGCSVYVVSTKAEVDDVLKRIRRRYHV